MTAAWMLYCVAIATIFVVVGHALERGLHLAARPIRWAWTVALAGSVLMPTAAWLWPEAFTAVALPAAERASSPPSVAKEGGAETSPVGAAASHGAFALADLDGVLRWAWALSSATVILTLAAAALRLSALRRQWRAAVIDGQRVLVSDNLGPAVAGLLPPYVVMPRWALRLGEEQRRLMLAHEGEHLRAGDPWLLAAGTAALVLAPWNVAVWWLLRRLRLAVEIDCDARVLGRGHAVREYGELLLQVGQRSARFLVGAPALGEPRSFLEHRIRRMAPRLPRWRWLGATAALVVSAAAIIAACEAPRPVGPEVAAPPDAVATPAPARLDKPDGAYLGLLARQYHPEVFAHPIPGAAVAFVFDSQNRVVGHSGGVRKAVDRSCLDVVDRMLPEFRASNWSSGGCAAAADNRGAVVVYWKSLTQVRDSGPVLTESVVDERPTLVSGPPLQYPNLLRQAGIQGRVIVRAIIDSSGRAEPASVQVIESPHPGFNQSARNAVLQARFRHGRFRGRAVRVLIQFPVDFRTSGGVR
jgi:TonB family protein